MFAVASGATGGSKILILQQGNSVNAIGIKRPLVCRHIVGTHVLHIGMATGAHGGDIGGVDSRGRLIGRVHRMTAVAVKAGGNPRISFFQALPVHTLSELRPLVSRQVVLAHQLSVRVAGGTQRRN